MLGIYFGNKKNKRKEIFMEGDRRVKFQIKIVGYARAFVPSYISDDEMKEYLSDFTPVYAGNKMLGGPTVQVSDIEPDE